MLFKILPTEKTSFSFIHPCLTLFQLAAVYDKDTGEMIPRPNFSYDEAERTVKISTEGTCKAVYGIEQVSHTVKQV